MVIPVNVPDKVLAALHKKKPADQNVMQYIAQILSDYVAQNSETQGDAGRPATTLEQSHVNQKTPGRDAVPDEPALGSSSRILLPLRMFWRSLARAQRR
jgi:hypothetical protein